MTLGSVNFSDEKVSPELGNSTFSEKGFFGKYLSPALAWHFCCGWGCAGEAALCAALVSLAADLLICPALVRVKAFEQKMTISHKKTGH